MRVRILGVDPGLATVGYGVIDVAKGKLVPVDYGVIETPAKLPLPRRLS
ncbi:MAG: crossover junction endodeoxyribonuclease RuvC, partial [Christensenellales bacterium]